jgi:hypothetical protein
MVSVKDFPAQESRIRHMNYQPLLDAAVKLLDADRGFVVLRETPGNTVAAHNFDPALLQQTSEVLDEDQHLREMLNALLAHPEPIITSNTRYELDHREVRLIGWVLRAIIIVPLNQALLWCDKSVRAKGLWSPKDLERATALVNQFDEP